MKPRVLTSVFYVLVWIILVVMKWTIPAGWGALGFDVLFAVVSVIGAYEFLRAMGGVSYLQKAFTVAFCVIGVPLYVIMQLTMGQGFLAVACAFCIYLMFLAAASVFDHGNSSVKGTITCVFCMLYCGVLAVIMSAINHLPNNSMVAILVLFASTILTDTGAFLFGSTLKKYVPMKLAPKLSPNKTVIGACGGVIGGVVGAIIAYLLIYYFGGLNGEIVAYGFNGVYLTFTSEFIHPIVTFILVGFFTSIMAQIGDLFESAIKRECGIKDMGKCLPGHGGVLDRFDSMLYCSVVILLSFGTIII